MSDGAGNRGSASRKERHDPALPLFRSVDPDHDDRASGEQRTGRELALVDPDTSVPVPAHLWESLPVFRPDSQAMAGNALFMNSEQHEATRYFDMMRTRIAQAMSKEGWRSLAVTSPGEGCGKSFVAANLALSFARLPSCRTVLMDLSLREPELAGLFGLTSAPPILPFLRGLENIPQHFRRIGETLALVPNGAAVAAAAEALQDPNCALSLSRMHAELEPDIVICDTAPALSSDDVISLTGRVDAVLLVVDGTRTSRDEIAACERLFEGRFPILAVVLNRAQDRHSWLGRARPELSRPGRRTRG